MLEQFNILLSDPEKELHAVAESICQEHQNHLLVLELTAKNNALLNICTEQELQLARLELKVTKSDKECISYKQTILDLNNQVTEQRNSWRQNNHPATTGANPARNKNQLSDSQKIRLMIEPTSLLDGLYSKHAFFIPHGTAIDTNYLEEEIKNNTFD